jgi:hypothetical protein
MTLAKGFSRAKATMENSSTVTEYDENLEQLESLHLAIRPILKLQKAIFKAEHGAAAKGKGKNKKQVIFSSRQRLH